MRIATRFGLLALLLLTGCNGWAPRSSDDSDRLEDWISTQQYGRALQELEQRSAEGDLAARRRLEAVREQAADYDRSRGDAIQDLVAEQRWEEAERALREARAHFPDGQHIQYAARVLAESRRARAERLESELLLARVDWLKESRPLWAELAELDPYDLEAAWHLSDTERQLKASGARLGQLGLNALSRGNYERAERLLGAAAALAPSEEYSRALRQISEQQNRAREAKQGRARQREELLRKQTVETLAGKVQEAIGAGKLDRARALLGQLESLEGGNEAAAPLRDKLRAALVQRIQALNARAEEFYAAGEAAAAQEAWQEARRTLADLAQSGAPDADVERLQEGLQETIIRRVQALVREGDRLYTAGLGDAARETWKEARVVLDQLHSLYPKQPKIGQLQKDLEDTIAGRVQILIKQGDDLYAAGQIAEARQLWQEATQLAPGHPELVSRLERADKVLERLQELTNGEPVSAD